MSTVDECYAAARHIVGQTITRVRYIGLSGTGIDADWDFGDWHWPESGVEFETDLGEHFYATWGWLVVPYDLIFAPGSIKKEWPLVDDPEHSRVWDVTDHPRWRGLVGTPITRADIATFVGEQQTCWRHVPGVPAAGTDATWVARFRPSATAPMAIRLETSLDCAWILAAQPNNWDPPIPTSLRADGVDLESDEVVVMFGDEQAARLALSVGTAAPEVLH